MGEGGAEIIWTKMTHDPGTGHVGMRLLDEMVRSVSHVVRPTMANEVYVLCISLLSTLPPRIRGLRGNSEFLNDVHRSQPLNILPNGRISLLTYFSGRLKLKSHLSARPSRAPHLLVPTSVSVFETLCR